MIVTKEHRNLQVSDAVQRQHVTIKASAEMVRRVILPYTKFELAAVRETINNAADACNHLAIQAPNTLDPTFRLRDYGPGIPQQQMLNFYREAGYSTKTQTNINVLDDGTQVQVMGCKGVGRFAPLGVSDEFIIRNFQAGKCLTGRVYFDSEGMPTFDVIDTSDSTEPSGVEISFAVDPLKVGAFRSAMVDVLRGFDGTCKIEWIGEEVEVPKLQAKFSGNGWWIGPGPGLLMGRIVYKIDPHEFMRDDYDLYQLFEYGKLLLRVPLGSIDVNDAREQVISNDRMASAVKTALDTLKTELAARISNDISSATTYWEACAKYREIADRKLHGRFGTKGVKWNGKPVDTAVSYDLNPGRHNQQSQTAHTPLPLNSIPVYSMYEIRQRKKPKPSYRASGSVAPDEAIFILNDKPKYLTQRLQQLISNDPAFVSSLELLNREWRRNMHVYVVPPDKEADYLDAFGNPPIFIKASDIPDLPPAAVASRQRQQVTLKVWDASSYDWKDGQPDLNDHDLTYLEFCNGSSLGIIDPAKHKNAQKLFHASAIARAPKLFGIVVPTRIRVDASNKHYIKKSKWRPFGDWLEELAQKLLADTAFMDRLHYFYLMQYHYPTSNPLRMVSEGIALLDKTLPVLKSIPQGSERQDFHSYIDFSTKVTTPKLAEQSTHIKTLAKVVDDHPLLPYLVNGGVPANLVTDYINR